MEYRHVLITGASSGLGKALAGAFAAPGVTLSLTGRNAARLRRSAEDCIARGALTDTRIMDITDGEEAASWVRKADAKQPVDLVIANAGISGGPGAGGGETAEVTRRIFAVNVDGVLNTVLPAIPLMRERQRGQIAIISSLAGLRGMPSAPAYSASKAAVLAYGEALRGALAGDGIGVTTVCPGFIRTPLTAVNQFRMPFILPPEEAAAIIARRLPRNPARIAFPFPLYAAMRLLNCLPSGISGPLFARLPKKS